MSFLDQLYEAAGNAGFLKKCTWRPSTGAPAQTEVVGFAAPDGTAFDGLTSSTQYVMSYPDTAFTALPVRENVEIGGARPSRCVRSGPSATARSRHRQC
jgi:hypothetical protein